MAKFGYREWKLISFECFKYHDEMVYQCKITGETKVEYRDFY